MNMSILKPLAIAALSIAMLTSAKAAPAHSEPAHITCTGILIDVDVRTRAQWPLAVIWDADGNYACTVDREGSRHDPLRPCNAGEKCRIVGTFRKIGQTYSIRLINSVDNVDRQ
jgi:hypothetical protein